MAIQVQINDEKIADGKLALAITTTNDAYPGEERRFEASYDTVAADGSAVTAVQIKDKIGASIRLLWVATATKTWEIEA